MTTQEQGAFKLPTVSLPRSVPQLRERPPQANIAQERLERENIKRCIDGYVERVQPVPPLGFKDLRRHTRELIQEHGLNPAHEDYIAVLLNNRVWREQLAAVPYDRRLLLLPKCLRVEEKCPAPFDEFGLLCKQCGLCSIQDLQTEGERLGYATLVAEGSAIVMQMIESGQVEAIVGVSCLSVLEMAFPYTEAAAIPCIAIPLLQDDCKDTTVDESWVWDAIHLTSADKTRRMDIDTLKEEVQSWFREESLVELIPGEEGDPTVALGREWLARAGKRWRPFLTASAFRALQDDPDAPLPDDLKKIAVAVECFHKASLIHDDIEDDDDLRYGESTLHAGHGVPVALNVGDFLIGEGYRLLAECDAEPTARARMLQIAATGHRSLSLGQGAELNWVQHPVPLRSRQVLGIFRQKTAPAFQVALQIGAVRAGACDATLEVLENYSTALGIAYQIRDDLEDLEDGEGMNDLDALRPTLPLALAHERCKASEKGLLTAAWRREKEAFGRGDEILALIDKLKVRERAGQLLDAYKEAAVRSLVELENPSLKGLLRRMISKIFTLEIKGWCSEFEARNAPGGEARAQAAG